MIAEIITIGDEILIGQTVDTNSAWMGKTLNAIGIKINRISSIQDDEDSIVKSIENILEETQLVLITGGLGPTKDDITKHTLCRYFEGELIRNQEVEQRILTYFKSRNREILASNLQQADLPSSATILLNDFGTASGMWFEKNNKIFISMPGVPYEMKHLVKDRVIPEIKERFQLPVIYHKTIMTEGIGESFLVELIKNWEDSLINEQIKIAYLPSPGIVKVRLTAEGIDYQSLKKRVDKKANELNEIVPQYIYGVDEELMEANIGKLLKKRNETLSTAESCTGGYISHLMTSIAGSSTYFLGGIISYANSAKENILGIDGATILKEGAVSQQVVEQMAKQVRTKFNSNYALATSGVAGPDGGSEEKPVGTVWIAFASKDLTFSKKFMFEHDRSRNIRRATLAALGMLRRGLNKELY